MTKLTREGLQLPVLLGMAALLTGCILPEKLDANIVVTGYHYDVALEGRLAEPRTVGALAKGQALPSNHEAQMKAQEALALQLPGMSRFAYVGGGRYDFAMRIEGELSRETPIIGFPNTRAGNNNFLTIRRNEDGTVVISSPDVPAKALADLEEVGLAASGTISIDIDGQVLESNADDQPAEGPHIWNRKSWSHRISLKFAPESK
ncbi:hypothetical protein DSM25558_3268 [Agrobacterium sp. DSM 25558]|uniref:hypothetical protein n=1 Tax=Agrobacterium sp. DSM 25558 TaxID=1907665 RepID=UPI000972524E|nr:hypothetical protein [Agrobacterium sp. DSM 25558]SCX22991.1 hypothetical protein DSM25558_3268 [Agrobacterium sp. DSM 25558]